MKNANKPVYAVLIILFFAALIAARISRGDTTLRRTLEENREFYIRVSGETEATVNLTDLLGMQPEDFTTVFATSVTKAREAELRGVQLSVILDSLGIDARSAEYLTVSGLDGYYTVLTGTEVVKEQNVYICFAMDGEMLKTQSGGGMGPFMLVIRSEYFARRWCKYVEMVDIKPK